MITTDRKGESLTAVQEAVVSTFGDGPSTTDQIREAIRPRRLRTDTLFALWEKGAIRLFCPPPLGFAFNIELIAGLAVEEMVYGLLEGFEPGAIWRRADANPTEVNNP